MADKYWISWFKAAGIRALKTLAETAIATIGTTLMLHDVNWELVISASVLAAVLSLLASLGGIPEVELPSTKESTETEEPSDDSEEE